ncbi:MAG: UDP-3-O-(3-hydroxymyristoyl)glucosamine N-acyltransferase [Chloroflexi bacterium]|nr:UDP-3-O-(3-hydroxymyristoyl)glucosamine N-acyltransferase [Chloroflexota bacterium]
MKELSISELAIKLQGAIVGSFNKDTKIIGTCTIDNYVKDKVSFIRNRKYGELLAGLQNAIVLIPKTLSEFCTRYPQNTYIVVQDVLDSLIDLQDYFYRDFNDILEVGISGTSFVDESAIIGEKVYIGENVFIGKNVIIGDGTKILHNTCLLDGVTLGSGTRIYPGVCVYSRCYIGDDCTIDSGARIGGDGFRFEQDIEHKRTMKIQHAGVVKIGNRVEVGANSAVDRATFEDDATVLSDDVKIDNLVHIGHNAKIGPRTLIAAQTCIGGSDKIGEDVWIGIGVTISNGVSIGNRAKILLNAVVAYDVSEDEMVSGFYAMPHRQWKQAWKKLREGYE